MTMTLRKYVENMRPTQNTLVVIGSRVVRVYTDDDCIDWELGLSDVIDVIYEDDIRCVIKINERSVHYE